MKELLKKLRWKWHRDIMELGFGELRAEMEESVTKIEKMVNYRVSSINDADWGFEEGGVTVELEKLRAAIREYNRIKQAVIDIGPIKNSAMRDVRALANREDILQYLPKGGICAEVGVMYGDFSKLILQTMRPSVFYAIDAFEFSDIWGRTDFADSHLSHLEWYEREFSKEIRAGKLKTVKGYSWNALETFDDDYFDFIYLDADHSFDSAMRDVEVIRQKIKNGGIIAFNDYTLHNFWEPGTHAGAYYGVVPAVNKLVNETNSEVLFLGMEIMQTNDIVIRFWD